MTRNQTMQVKVALCVLLIAGGAVACSGPADSGPEKTPNGGTAIQEEAPLSVAVVNYPLMYFAERVGGPDVRVALPAPADGDPAYWDPGPEQIALYQEADLILLNGASYAKWVPRVSLPTSRMVDTSASFADRYIPLTGETTHSHGDTGEHQHGGVAFTTWLDPVQAIAQAEAIQEALARLRPEAAAGFQERFAALEADLRELDDRFAAVITEGGSRSLLFSHPVYQYFIRHYEIDGAAVHWEPEEQPTPEQWKELKALLSARSSRLMVWEGTPEPATVAGLKEQGLDSVVFDPCGGVPEEGDYLSVMRKNASRLSGALNPVHSEGVK
jgi:zinc transport system substrate-binding protein